MLYYLYFTLLGFKYFILETAYDFFRYAIYFFTSKVYSTNFKSISNESYLTVLSITEFTTNLTLLWNQQLFSNYNGFYNELNIWNIGSFGRGSKNFVSVISMKKSKILGASESSSALEHRDASARSFFSYRSNIAWPRRFFERGFLNDKSHGWLCLFRGGLDESSKGKGFTHGWIRTHEHTRAEIEQAWCIIPLARESYAPAAKTVSRCYFGIAPPDRSIPLTFFTLFNAPLVPPKFRVSKIARIDETLTDSRDRRSNVLLQSSLTSIRVPLIWTILDILNLGETRDIKQDETTKSWHY